MEQDKLKSDVEESVFKHIKQKCTMGNPSTKVNRATSLRLQNENALEHDFLIQASKILFIYLFHG